MSFLIVSGLSGSGKSIALEALEDIGFYCIDNLPVTLLPHLAVEIREGSEGAMRNVAVGLDARSREFVRSLSASLAELRRQDLKAQILFLAADDGELIKRFQETRRRHPLTDDHTPLVEGIRREREMLEALASDATLRLDTTHMTPHELRRMVQNFARGAESPGLTVMFESFGYKNGTPNDADYVFDVRCLPNPYWKVELRKLTGLDPPVIAWLESDPRVGDMAREISGFLERWLPAFDAEHRSYLTVALGCTGGQHRSVYLVNRLAEHFAARGVKTLIRHRELK
jgi:UPF0042 nucleotide-binding protein